MPQISDRLTGVTPGGSDGWELFMKARKMVAAGVPVIELTIGEHDIRTDPSILNAMHAAALGGHTGYASVPGIPGLRDAVAARVAERTGVPTSRENVLIAPGGQAALFAAHIAACPEGAKALFIDPYYATYPGTVRGVGGIATPVQARAENSFQPDPADLEAAAQGAASLMINTPNNPTGVVYTRETLEGIADVCRRHDLWLISDEVYDTQIWNGAHLSPRALPGMAKRTLVVGSMSKSHAMTGSRIGWIVGPADVIDHLSNLATHTTYGVAGFIQDAALFALQQADGAMYMMLDIRKTGMTGEAFADALLERDHIAVMPGESFGAAAAGHLRVAMTTDDAQFADALERLCARAASFCD